MQRRGGGGNWECNPSGQKPPWDSPGPGLWRVTAVSRMGVLWPAQMNPHISSSPNCPKNGVFSLSQKSPAANHLGSCSFFCGEVSPYFDSSANYFLLPFYHLFPACRNFTRWRTTRSGVISRLLCCPKWQRRAWRWSPPQKFKLNCKQRCAFGLIFLPRFFSESFSYSILLVMLFLVFYLAFSVLTWLTGSYLMLLFLVSTDLAFMGPEGRRN